MTLIKTEDSNEFGKTRETGFGPISFDETGIADVTPEAAQTLTSVSPTLSIYEGEFESKEPVDPSTLTGDEVITDTSKVIEPIIPAAEPIIETPVITESVIQQSPVIEPVIEETTQSTEEVVTETAEETTEESVVIEPVVEETQSATSSTEDEQIKASLEGKNMTELRDLLAGLNVPVSEYDHFKGKDAKPELIAFILTKL